MPAPRPHPQSTHPLGRLGSRAHRERGEATQFAVLAGTAILAIFTIVQAWLYYAAGNTARSAAQAGLQATRVQHGSARAGQQAALQNAAAVGGITNLQVTANRGPAHATVTVTGTAPSVIPLLTLPPIRAEASGAVERTTTP
ncbi:hypothetical protein [Intrasporangium sp.]|uniref:hypothetical protein n=1 Tax=Intrasporangium sp. TaxID=1925024 RepID=UPI003221E59F